MSAVADIQADQFGSAVLRSETPVLVDFYGTHCPACVRMLPVIQEIAAEREGKLKVVKLNAHENLDIAAQFGLRAVPSFVLLSNGQPVGQ